MELEVNLLGTYFPLSSVQGLAKGYQSLHQRGIDTSKLTKVKLCEEGSQS